MFPLATDFFLGNILTTWLIAILYFRLLGTTISPLSISFLYTFSTPVFRMSLLSCLSRLFPAVVLIPVAH
ncbi:hypothetical protein B0I37DRAFT_53595 [Chaetomium sp. MPI-CAGE-AT-0009]|nr:hypothetical protein B0I37DRAFT_53595 [Chaetomium sp. MPI-CAGE-AT-0009]